MPEQQKSNGKQTVTLDSIILATVNEVQRVAVQNGKSYSFQYWLEQCIVDGAAARKRSFEWAAKSRNLRNFDVGMSRINLDAPDALAQIVELKKKYSVGGTRVAV
ncbi:hypothetical protein LCGC14_2257040 [marine sediment metagenome]|uniref:Uncharacterized protein n=1 Tax=marine sediment metagenome TaxID=412755 RepID=A0A0F9FDE1_9ZZZZ